MLYLCFKAASLSLFFCALPTYSSLSSISLPFRAETAACAPSASSKLTKPNPRDVSSSFYSNDNSSNQRQPCRQHTACLGYIVLMLFTGTSLYFSQIYSTTQPSCNHYSCKTKPACVTCAQRNWEYRLGDSFTHKDKVNCLAGMFLQCDAACMVVAAVMLTLHNSRKAVVTFITTAEVTLPCSLNISFSFSSLTESGRFLTYTLVKCDSRSTGLSDFLRKGPTYTFCPAKSMPFTCQYKRH